MILAAGRGKRLQPLTDTTPKPLLKLDNFTIIEHLLFNLSAAGFKEIIINTAHLGEKITRTLQNGTRYGVSIIYSHELPGGLETGGGIFKALPLLGPAPFLVVSGDIWTDYPFADLKNKTISGLAHLVMVDNPQHHLHGDFNLSSNQLNYTEGRRLTFANIGIYHPNLFANCTPGFFKLGPLLHTATSAGQTTGEYFTGNWVNVGTLEILDALRKKLQYRD